jgi:hypothetical protein
MSMQTASVNIAGVSPLLLNNPQTVDRFNKFSKKIAAITAKRTSRTDEDHLELRRLEVESKLYFDDALGVYVPSTWLLEAIVKNSFKVAKVGMSRARGGVFMTASKCKLNFAGMEKVKTVDDIVLNDEFHRIMNIPQGQVRLIKACPSFVDWSFTAVIEFDDSIIDARAITRTVEHASRYNGFGDFRPTFGRATGTVQHA